MPAIATAKIKSTPRILTKPNVKAKKPIEIKVDNTNIINKGEKQIMKNEEITLTPAEQEALEMPAADNPSATEMDDSETAVQDLEQSLQEAERRGFEDMPWYFDIPKKERLRPRDIIYNVDLDRFGIFVAPARKYNLARMRLLKVASKEDVYTRDWFVPYESLALVKRGDSIKRGFVETDREYVRRAGKINRGHKESEETTEE